MKTTEISMLNSIRKGALALVAALVAAISFSPTVSDAAPQYATSTRTTWASDVVTALGGTAYVMILTGAQPANVATVDSGTVIVVMAMSATAGTDAAGVITMNAITSTNASAAGTAGHWLLCTTNSPANCTAASSTTRIVQGSAGTSGADMNFPNGATFASGETINMTSFTLTMGGA